MRINAADIKKRVRPISYFSRELRNLRPKAGSGWISVNCPFHDDKHPSMSVQLDSGGFICHACGAKGGDIIAFEMRRYSLSFRDAMRKLSQEWGLP